MVYLAIMRLPEFIFPIINFVVKTILYSPLHSVVSSSLMIVYFNGRKSGKQFSTPVRYIRAGDQIQCLTAKSNRWWKNIKDESDIELLVQGNKSLYRARVITDDPARIKDAIKSVLDQFPSDAPYYEISMQADRTPNEDDLEQASHASVLLEASPSG